MTNYLMMLVSSFFNAAQTTLTKSASKRTDAQYSLSFNAYKAAGAFIVILLLTGTGFHANRATFIAGTVNGLLVLLSLYTSFIALNCGNMAITATVVSYNIVIPFFYGIIWLHEPISFVQVIALLLIFISVLMMNFQITGEKLNRKWAVFTFLCFLGNGLSSVVQKEHQRAYPGMYCKEFIIITYLSISAIMFLIIFSGYKSIRCEAWKTAGLSGLFLGLSSVLSFAVVAVFNATVFFPTMAAFGALLHTAMSRLIFKDKLKARQIIAIIIGVISVIMLQR